MKISTEDFEKAVEIGFDHGVQNSLGELIVPGEWKARVQRAILDAYSKLTPDPRILANDGQRDPNTEDRGEL